MDDRSAWTPGEPPQPEPDAGQTWSAPSAPGATPYGGSSYSGSSDYAGYPTSSYPPPASSPYSPPPASPYAPPPSGPAQFGGPAPEVSRFGTPIQAPQGQPAFGAGPAGYPPPGQGYYGGPQPMAPYGGSPLPPYVPNPGTDGFAIAALVFGILGGWLSFVFGAIALNRIKKSGARGRGMAIAGMVTGAAILLLQIGLAVAVPVFLHQRTQALHASCASGDMAACDSLFDKTSEGTSEHTFADTCGGRTDGGYLCTSVGAVSYGDDAHLDSLWDACAAGDLSSCDELYYSAEPGSDYAQYGETCGGRTDGSHDCAAASKDETSST